MQLIGMLDSPYVRRVAVALIAAKVPFARRPLSIFRHIDEFSKLNALLRDEPVATAAGVSCDGTRADRDGKGGAEALRAFPSPARQAACALG